MRSASVKRALAAFALLICGVLPLAAHGYQAGTLEIQHPWSRATPTGAQVGVGYLVIRNKGQENDRLLAVESTVAGRVELHESKEVDGRAQMRPVPEGVTIPAGGEVQLAPGGYHAMFLSLKDALKEGTRFPATLVFEKAGRVDVEFVVEAMGAKTPAGGH